LSSGPQLAQSRLYQYVLAYDLASQILKEKTTVELLAQPALERVGQESPTPGRSLVLQRISRMQSHHKRPLLLNV